MKNKLSLVMFSLCLVISLPLAFAQNKDATSPFAGDPAWIAYLTNRTGQGGVWLIHPDGTGDHQVAADVLEEQLLPDWSPDGTRLVFATRVSLAALVAGETEPLYEYDLATQTSRELFACEDPCMGYDEPAYSPDGTKVAFIRYLGPFINGAPPPTDCALAIGEVATGEVTQITSNTEPPCDREYFPRWSPDGSQLTYWREPPKGFAVFVINADGTNERRLTDPEMFAADPDWSPDGNWIVFYTYPWGDFCCEVSNLYRMHPDGSGMEQLTHYETADLRASQPRYTPDGKYIVFTAVTPSTRSLWAIPAEGGEPVVLAPGGIYTHGTWQP